MQRWNGKERRAYIKDRRQADRRQKEERRFDYRNSLLPRPNRSMRAWMRSITKTRLGVDRRKRDGRRIIEDRRSLELRSLLTPEELADLLR